MYSITELLNAYKENKPMIEAYMRGDKSYEGFTVDINGSNQQVDASGFGAVLGVGIGIFIVLIVVTLSLFIWALVVLIRYREHLETWAIVVGAVGLVCAFVPGYGIIGPIITLLVVYLSKHTEKIQKIQNIEKSVTKVDV